MKGSSRLKDDKKKIVSPCEKDLFDSERKSSSSEAKESYRIIEMTSNPFGSFH
jgi:hypothetical protein